MGFLFRAVLVFYNLVLTGALLFSGVRSVGTSANRVLLLFLLPVAVYFAAAGIRRILALPGLSAIKGLAFSLSLATTSLLFVFNLLGAANSSEYLFALLVAPLPLYFWGVAGGCLIKGLRKPQAKEEPAVAEEPAPAAPLTRKDQVDEPQRRDFLKRIGSVGLGLLAYSILNPKQVGAAFFGSVPGPGTVAIKDPTDTKIDPAIKSPIDAFGISAIDDGATSYYGFIDKNGAWYILKEAPDTGYDSYLYVKGDTGFSDNWGTRKTRTDYAYFNQTF